MLQPSPGAERGGVPPRSGVRYRLALALRHVLRVVVPPEPRPSAALPPAPEVPRDVVGARLRARAALAQARAEMPGLVDDGPPPVALPAEYLLDEAAGLRQALRAYTDRVDRLLAASDEERRSLRDHVDRLTAQLLAVRTELAGVRVALREGGLVAQPPRLDAPAAVSLPPEPPASSTAAEPAPAVASDDPSADEAGPTSNPPGRPPSEETEAVATAAVQDRPPVGEQQAAGADRGAVDAIAEREQAVSSAEAQPPPVGPAAPEHAADAATVDARLDGGATRLGTADAATPAEPAVGPSAGTTPSRVESRVFAAGTVGITLVVEPVENFERVAALLDRLRSEPALEHVETEHYESQRMRLRLTFHQPTPWPRLQAAIEAAAEAAVDPASLSFTRGLLYVRLSTSGSAVTPTH